MGGGGWRGGDGGGEFHLLYAQDRMACATGLFCRGGHLHHSIPVAARMTGFLAGAVLLAVSLYFIVRFSKDENGFVRRTSRGLFMRDLNKRMQQAQESKDAD